MANSEGANSQTRQNRTRLQLTGREKSIMGFLINQGESNLAIIRSGTGIPYNTVSKIVRELVNKGYLLQESRGQYYVRGYKQLPGQGTQTTIPSKFLQDYLNRGWKFVGDLPHNEKNNDMVVVEYTLPIMSFKL